MTSPSSSLSSYTTCTSSYSFSRNNSASTTTVSTSLSRSPVSMTPAETTQPAQTINGYDAAAYALTAGGTLVSTAVEYGASAGGAAIQGAGTLAGTGLGRTMEYGSRYVLGNTGGTIVGSAVDLSMNAAAFTASSVGHPALSFTGRLVGSTLGTVFTLAGTHVGSISNEEDTGEEDESPQHEENEQEQENPRDADNFRK